MGDGAYACVALAHAGIGENVTLVSRLRLDARLYDFPEPQPKSKRGPKPKKGKRLKRLKELVSDDSQAWKTVKVRWYGGKRKQKLLLSGVCLWYTKGEEPVRIRWVLVVDPEGNDEPEAFFCTNIKFSPKRIIETFVLRWNVEVTFQEVRRHLGVETQRQWSDLAIARTTPALMGLYSLVCLMALQLIKESSLPIRQTAWYVKQEATFSDVLAFIRRTIWEGKYFGQSSNNPDGLQFSSEEIDILLEQLAAVP